MLDFTIIMIFFLVKIQHCGRKNELNRKNDKKSKRVKNERKNAGKVMKRKTNERTKEKQTG